MTYLSNNPGCFSFVLLTVQSWSPLMVTSFQTMSPSIRQYPPRLPIPLNVKRNCNIDISTDNIISNNQKVLLSSTSNNENGIKNIITNVHEYLIDSRVICSDINTSNTTYDERKSTLESTLSPIFDNSSIEPASIISSLSTDILYSYNNFAKSHPFTNNIILATVKTAAADLTTQIIILHQTITDSSSVINDTTVFERSNLASILININWERNIFFAIFGAVYIGAFQYFYQVNIFQKLFQKEKIDKFTNQSFSDKLKDMPGLITLVAQILLDMIVAAYLYLPLFYIFKEMVMVNAGDFVPSTIGDNMINGVESCYIDSSSCVSSSSIDSSHDALFWTVGLDHYHDNFKKDMSDVLSVWVPADIICFSVPLYLRLPIRHGISFFWTMYLSFMRGS